MVSVVVAVVLQSWLDCPEQLLWRIGDAGYLSEINLKQQQGSPEETLIRVYRCVKCRATTQRMYRLVVAASAGFGEREERDKVWEWGKVKFISLLWEKKVLIVPHNILKI